MNIALGCDHAGVLLKNELIAYLADKKLSVIDKGAHSPDRVHYPVYAKLVADAVVNKEADLGILICGSGIGVSIAANKVNGIRAAVCSEPYSARVSKEHNDSNILAIGARVVGAELAKMIVDAWLDARFSGGVHQERIDMLAAIEQGKRL